MTSSNAFPQALAHDRHEFLDPLSPEGPRTGCAIVGLGNTGSHAVDAVARIPGIDRIALIDFDTYTAGNVSGQRIGADDVGMSKVEAQKRHIESINPSLQVDTFACPVEDVPMSFLRGVALLGCVDNLAARMHLSQVSQYLDVPYIDVGVQATNGLWARITVYVPGSGRACVECALGPDDYAGATTNYPCQLGELGRRGPHGGAGTPVPTGAPASLGAIAAGMQALELAKRVTGRTTDLIAGSEVTLDLCAQKTSVSALWPNPECLADHQTWDIVRLARTPDALTLEQALLLPWPTAINRSIPAGGMPAGASLRIEGQRFCLRAQCEAGHSRDFIHLQSALMSKTGGRTCHDCSRPFMPVGSDLVADLTPDIVPSHVLGMSLASLGVRPGDVLSIEGPNGTVHYELRRSTHV